MTLPARNLSEENVVVVCDPCFRDAVEIATAGAFAVQMRVASAFDVPTMVRRSQLS